MNPVYIPMLHDEVISYLASTWPPRPNTPCLTTPPAAGITDGAVAVYPIPGRPGRLWWVVDSTVYVQDAGVPDEDLAALMPGSVLGMVPDPDPAPDNPPMG